MWPTMEGIFDLMVYDHFLFFFSFINLQVHNFLTLSVFVIFLILYGVSQLSHDVKLFQSENPHSLDETGQTISCAFAVSILVALQQLMEELVHEA